MNAEEILKLIRKFLEEKHNLKTSMIMYDPNKLQDKVSFAIMEENENGSHKSFIITVDDSKKMTDIYSVDKARVEQHLNCDDRFFNPK